MLPKVCSCKLSREHFQGSCLHLDEESGMHANQSTPHARGAQQTRALQAHLVTATRFLLLKAAHCDERHISEPPLCSILTDQMLPMAMRESRACTESFLFVLDVKCT